MRERFDIFCSYAHVDGEVVGRLVATLEAQGLAVYLDREELSDHESISRSIARGLARSKALLAYYSASYPTSRACQWELTAAFLAAQREGDPRPRVLVVNPEESADHIEPVELRDALFRRASAADDDQAFAALAESVAAHLNQLKGLLGEVQPLAPPGWFPEQRPGSRRFVGRLTGLWEVHSALQASGLGLVTGATSAVAQVRGLGGVGKSLLAEEYALRYGAAYGGGVFWLRAFGDGEGSLDPGQREAERQRQLAVLAARVGIKVADLRPDEVEGALGRWLGAQAEPCLWIVDDLPSGLHGQFRRWLAPHPAAKTLITTRSREYDALGGRIELGELPQREALELLTRRRQPESEQETAAARAIAAELGCHPLALDVAAAALRYQRFQSFLSALKEPSEDWLERLTAELRDTLPNGHERSIARTLWRSIDRLGEEGRDFLRLASVLATAPVSAEFVADVFAAVDGHDERRAAELATNALNQVDSLSLAEGAGGLMWRVHTLVSRTVRFRDRALDRTEALRQAATSTLNAKLPQSTPVSSDCFVDGVVPHARELTKQAGDLPELQLLDWLARYDHGRADYRSATQLFQRGHDASRRLFGADHPDTLTALNDLALTLRASGDFARARELHEHVLKARRRVLGDEHPKTLTALSSLAGAHRAAGDIARARELDEQALEARRRVLGDEHPDVLISLNNLGLTLSAEGDIAGARELHERAIELSRRVHGDEHPMTLAPLNNLGLTLRTDGDLARARELHERAFELSGRVHGDEHPATLTSLSNLAMVLHDQGDLSRARELQEQAFEGRRRVLGNDHPDALASLNNLAETLWAQGDLKRARELHEQALEGNRRVLGDEHPSTLTSLNNLAALLNEQGDLAGARELQEEGLGLSRRVLGNEHPTTLALLNHLANTLRAQGDFVGARKLMESGCGEA